VFLIFNFFTLSHPTLPPPLPLCYPFSKQSP
jgi:hypothetical protein